ncbi:FG-GAP repeat protein [Melioribacter roseus P3M-2]|uniref:FG-GAP repeat protein n=1 Tax=Melioribacter roseus (strain DSM 23840 / JCM 17771 / VKM B-2668 / P3M-2) TaxID=1191523 RepID=I6YX16_MELRP|nr:T9SS type A sorting domain-containing protein [Melioribacter roseus]AFN75122.1 FG-GAP repeat protein [Melioribacter roseus P3M-2]
MNKSNLKIFLWLGILIPGLLFAGSQSEKKFSITRSLPNNSTQNAAIGKLKILAVMVEFQEDNDEYTYGNGKFGSVYTEDYGDTIIDPLPHDRTYFENHLEFAKNYFYKVSDGKLNIEYTVLPEIITVSKTMRNYAPPLTNPDDLGGLANFAGEVWDLADSVYADLDFSQYDLFTIFHAGAGAAFYPTGKIGYERDLPSVFLGFNTLQKYLGNDFAGFTVKNDFNIRNTVILPSTESKEVQSFGEKYLYQMSINGLIVSNIGSYLGLPDLFNTETGVTAIDRFGLMDGNAIFAYSGLFPPEPSPWEKIFLGWVEPVVLNANVNNVHIAAKLAAAAGDTVIVKIPINDHEYFLVENRQRDVNKDGITLTYKIGDNVYTFNTQKDTGRFRFDNADTMRGVVVDVDEFDWAVPANGIVIWHIDEKIINEKYAENRVNADLYNKGVDIEEADGIQDIGELFNTVFGEVYGIAGEEDLWYKGNKARFYKNRFGSDTKPNSNSNSGAKSFITIDNFSEPGNVMTFDLFIGNDRFLKLANILLDGNYKFVGGLDNLPYIFLINNHDLIIRHLESEYSLVFPEFSEVSPSIFSASSNFVVVGANNNQFNKLTLSSALDRVISQNSYNFSENEGSKVITPVTYRGLNFYTLMGTDISRFLRLDHFTGIYRTFDFSEYGKIVQISAYRDQNDFALITDGGYFITGKFPNDVKNRALNLSGVPVKLITLLKPDGKNEFIVLNENNGFDIIAEGGIRNSFVINTADTIKDFAIYVNQTNGTYSILVVDKNKVLSFNSFGILNDNFPITASSELNDYILTTDLNNDGVWDILVSSVDGNLFAWDGASGDLLQGFPISTGASLKVPPVLFTIDNSQSLTNFKSGIIYASVDAENYLNCWFIATDNPSSYGWHSVAGDLYNSYTITLPAENIIDEYFPESKAYNWPNPVYGNETYIRYFVAEDSDVEVTILDAAGDYVTTLKGTGRGGFDNEIRWDVSDVPSGVYFARINVSSADKAAAKLIKIAIIK